MLVCPFSMRLMPPLKFYKKPVTLISFSYNLIPPVLSTFPSSKTINMKHLIVYAHPNKGSLNAHFKNIVVQTLYDRRLRFTDL